MLEYCGDLAAVGTVADVMPLTGENRTIVKAGLRQLQIRTDPASAPFWKKWALQASR